MTAVKIDRQKEIDELLARIYLDTKIKLTKKELLEFIFDQSSKDYPSIIANLKQQKQNDGKQKRKLFIQTFSGVVDLLSHKMSEDDPKSIWKTKVEE